MPNPELVQKALRAKQIHATKNDEAVNRVIAHQVAASLRMEGIKTTAREILQLVFKVQKIDPD